VEGEEERENLPSSYPLLLLGGPTIQLSCRKGGGKKKKKEKKRKKEGVFSLPSLSSNKKGKILGEEKKNL